MDTALDILNKLIVNIFEIYIILQFLDIVFCNKFIDKRIGKIVICLQLILTLLVDYYVPYVWVNFIVSLGTIFLLVCCYKSSIYKKIIVAIGVNLMLAASEVLVALVIGSEYFGLFSRAANEESIALFLSRLVFWVIVTCIKQYKTENKPIKLSIKIFFFGAVVIINTLGELIIICSQNEKNSLLELTSLFGAGITISLLIYLYDCLVKIFMEHTQIELVRKEKEYYHREAEMIQQNQETTQHFRHDWKNRIQVMNQLANEEQWEELKKYLLEVEDKVSDMQLYSNTGNLLVDSIINSKLYTAKKREISVIANIVLPKDIGIDNDDMVVILGNLLDNAIEANENGTHEKRIELSLRYEEGCILIHIQNTFGETPITNQGKYLTRKKNASMHGIGIKSIEDTVEKYHGITEISIVERLFVVDIMMYQ